MPNVTQYTTLARLARRLALRDVPETSQTEKIDEVSRLMDGYFRARFTLPFTQVGTDVQINCEAICTWQLLLDRGVSPNAGMGEEGLKSAYDQAIRWLEGVRDGKITPDVTSPGAPEGVPTTRARMTSSPSRGWSTRSPGGCGPGGFIGGPRES